MNPFEILFVFTCLASMLGFAIWCVAGIIRDARREPEGWGEL